MVCLLTESETLSKPEPARHILSLGSSHKRLSSSEVAFSWIGGAEGLGHNVRQKAYHEGWALQAMLNWAHFEGPWHSKYKSVSPQMWVLLKSPQQF